MLPPALGGLRVRVPPIPGHPAPGSMSKITLRRMLPLERRYYTKNPPEQSGEILAKSEALRNFRAKICHSIQLLLNIRLRCGQNRISPDDRREEPRSISTDRRSLPKAVARVVALCGVRMCRGKVKRADGTSASADATKKSAPCGR